MKLKSDINQTDQTDQYDQARGEEKGDKFNWIFKRKGAQQGFYSKKKKKERKKSETEIFAPPEG